MNDLENVIKAVYESRYLKRIKRSGTDLILGDQVQESVVEHSFYASLWAIVIHHLNPKLDLGKLLTMCIIHDLEEVRTGDIHQLNRLYFTQDPEIKAFADMWKESDLGKRLINIHIESHERKTAEALAARDCDVLAELVLEKEYLQKGVKEAKEWIEFTIKRLKTKEGKQISKVVQQQRMTKWFEEIKNKIRERYQVRAKKYE